MFSAQNQCNLFAYKPKNSMHYFTTMDIKWNCVLWIPVTLIQDTFLSDEYLGGYAQIQISTFK
jgi:hypothetical protein